MTKCLQNLHTHTTYCDGKDTTEEMILAAYQQLARLPEYGDFDFIAHFDLITKYCEQLYLFLGVILHLR